MTSDEIKWHQMILNDLTWPQNWPWLITVTLFQVGVVHVRLLGTFEFWVAIGNNRNQDIFPKVFHMSKCGELQIDFIE